MFRGWPRLNLNLPQERASECNDYTVKGSCLMRCAAGYAAHLYGMGARAPAIT
jgi:hypothetical protein